MRLLKCTQPKSATAPAAFSLTEFPASRIPLVYAVLSHRWTSDEVTLRDLDNGVASAKESYRKLEFCAEKAAEDGINYFWVDTCCIDKSSSAELSEAINSMFKWYKNATKCYVYMSDVSATKPQMRNSQPQWIAAFRESVWFTRGWTLQELIAPDVVEFFSEEGSLLGDKRSLEQDIHQITGVPIEALKGSPLSIFDEQERLAWAARRVTTVEEDAAYCLLGLFNVHMPLIYGEGQQKAMDRLRREIQVSNSALSLAENVPWIVPFERNTRFTGREEELEAMERRLFSQDRTSKWAIIGLGGVGKTQLTIELLYRVRQRYRDCMVIWIPAISSEGLRQSCVSIARKLDIPGCDDVGADGIELLREYLSNISSGRWLLVFDNADDVDIWTTSQMPEQGTLTQERSQRLIDKLPQNKRGCIIFTTRDRKAATIFAGSNVVPISAMSRAMATEMLKKYLIKPNLVDNSKITMELLAGLMYLPLAIVQAAAYINRNECDLEEYLELLNEEEEEVVELLSEDFEVEGRYHSVKSPVATTWLISFKQIQKHHPLATEYLSFMACVHYKDIPQALLPPGQSRRKEIEAIGTLTAYSFVERRAVDSALDLHRLVHLSIRNWLRKEDILELWQDKTVTRLEEVFPTEGDENRSTWRMYLPHAQAVLGSSDERAGVNRTALMERCASCLFSDGRWTESEALFSQVAKMEDIIFALPNSAWLAEIYRRQGRLEEAEKLQLEVLEGWKNAYGADHLNVIISSGNLALTYLEQRRWDEAEKIQVQVLEDYKRLLGPEHPRTLFIIGSLALTYSDQRRWDEAEQLQKQVLEVYRRKQGPDHTDTTTTMHNLASTYISQERWKEAEELCTQVMEITGRKLGIYHPDRLITMHNLALIWHRLGREAEAIRLMKECIEAQTGVFSPSHPQVSLSTNALRDWEAEAWMQNQVL